MPFYIKAYGICLRERPDREASLRCEIARLQLPYEIMVNDRPATRGPFTSTGERGCYESHLRVLRKALSDNVDAAIICEDDLWVSRSSRSVLNDVLTLIPNLNWTTMYLGYPRHFLPSTTATLVSVAPHLRLLEGWEVLCSHFYAVRSHTIPELILELEWRLRAEKCISVDGVLNEFRRDRELRPLVVVPSIGRQMPSYSSIGSRSHLAQRMETFGLGRMVMRLRKVAKRVLFEGAVAAGNVAPALFYRRRTVTDSSRASQLRLSCSTMASNDNNNQSK
jgi:GR25 family glycosyltransferase involved in LPS biosynthesis